MNKPIPPQNTPIRPETAPLLCNTSDETYLQSKLSELERYVCTFKQVALAFSGGVDSTFLAAVCKRCMPHQTLLIHLNTPFICTPEQESYHIALEYLNLPYIELDVDVLSNQDICRNPANRCYVCKKQLMTALVTEAKQRGCTAVFEGSNSEDAHDYRPGMRAIEELSIKSPLLACGFTKDEERLLLRAWGYESWNLPAGACLATRSAPGEQINTAKLQAIRSAEDYLHGQGLKQVRVRISNKQARVCVSPQDLKLMQSEDLIQMSTSELFPNLLNTLSTLSHCQVDTQVYLYHHGETSVLS